MDDDNFASRRFGYVFFDNEMEPEDGYACISGSSPKRISGVNELPSDVIWWSNMNFDNFFKKTDAWRFPWLRHDKYLVVSPRDVLKEWGLNPVDPDPMQSTHILAEVFNRIMLMAFRLIRDVNPKARMEEVFTGKFLREDVRCILPEAEYPRDEAASIIKSGNAWQEFTQTGVSPVRGGRWVMLRRPRLSYAQEMFHTPVPKGPFEHFGRRDLRSLLKDGNGWVLNNDNPCIAEIALNRIQGDIAPIYGFGNATDKDNRIARSWVSHPELIVMSEFSEINIKSVFMGDHYDLIGPHLPQPVKDFLSSKFSEISWSAGVVAETLWRACTLGEDKTKSKMAGTDRAHASWQGVWVKGADKTQMFLSAMSLTDKGYSVISYGLGWVRVTIHEDQIPDLIRHGLQLGLLPQLSDLPKGMFRADQKVPWVGDVSSMALAQFTLTSNRDLLWGIDGIPLMSRKDRKKSFQELLKRHGRG